MNVPRLIITIIVLTVFISAFNFVALPWAIIGIVGPILVGIVLSLVYKPKATA